MNICKRCKYFSDANGNDIAHCLKDSVLVRDPVYGIEYREGKTCRERREDENDPCGPEGKQYEYKPPKCLDKPVYFMWEAK